MGYFFTSSCVPDLFAILEARKLRFVLNHSYGLTGQLSRVGFLDFMIGVR